MKLSTIRIFLFTLLGSDPDAAITQRRPHAIVAQPASGAGTTRYTPHALVVQADTNSRVVNGGLCAPPIITQGCASSTATPTTSSTSLSLQPEPSAPVFKDDPSPEEERIEQELFEETNVIIPFNLSSPVAKQLCQARYADTTHAQIFVLGCMIQCSNGTLIFGDDEATVEGVVFMPDGSFCSDDGSMVCVGGQCCAGGTCHEDNGMESKEVTYL